VTIFCGWPYLFMIRLRSFSAAALSRLAVHRLQKLAFMVDGAPARLSALIVALRRIEAIALKRQRAPMTASISPFATGAVAH
jgi:hypothetical protein